MISGRNISEIFEDTIAHAFGRIAFIALPIVSIGTNNSTIRALSCYTWIMPRLKPPKQIEQLPSFTMKGCRINAKMYTL